MASSPKSPRSPTSHASRSSLSETTTRSPQPQTPSLLQSFPQPPSRVPPPPPPLRKAQHSQHQHQLSLFPKQRPPPSLSQLTRSKTQISRQPHERPPAAMQNPDQAQTGKLRRHSASSTRAARGDDGNRDGEHPQLRKRSGSIASVVSFGRSITRILPANRKERGGTLRQGHEGEDNNTDDVVQDAGKLRMDVVQAEIEPKAQTPTRGRSLRKMFTGLPKRIRGEVLGTNPVLQIPGQSFPAVLPGKKTQQLYDEKKARREQRRSYRESGDYLAMEGVNPQTGYHSHTATSSSEPSGLDSETRRALEESEQQAESARQELAAAVERKESLKKAAAKSKERKKREKSERREARGKEARARRSREGRWRSDDQGWKIVRESELSPILQSVAGSLKSEVPADDKLQEMRVPKNKGRWSKSRTPDPSTLPRDYKAPYVESVLNDSQDKYVVETSKTPQGLFWDLPAQDGKESSRLPKQGDEHDLDSQNPRPVAIRRKPVGSGIQRRDASTETIIHHENVGNIPIVDQPSPAERDFPLLSAPVPPPKIEITPPKDEARLSTNVARGPFLDKYLLPVASRPGSGKEVTATSSLSPTTKPVLNHLQSDQSLNGPGFLEDIIFPNESLLVTFPEKRFEEEFHKPQLSIVHQERSRRIEPAESQASTIIIPIITTTGLDPLLVLPMQVDGPTEEDSKAHYPPSPKYSSKIPITSQKRATRSSSPNVRSHQETADTGTLSEAHRPVLKKRISRLCLEVSQEDEKKAPKSTPTSTSTFPRRLAQRSDKLPRRTMSRNSLSAVLRSTSISHLNVQRNHPSIHRARSMETLRRSDRDMQVFNQGDEGIDDPSSKRRRNSRSMRFETIGREESLVRGDPRASSLLQQHQDDNGGQDIRGRTLDANRETASETDQPNLQPHKQEFSDVDKLIGEGQCENANGRGSLSFAGLPGMIQTPMRCIAGLVNPTSDFRRRFRGGKRARNETIANKMDVIVFAPILFVIAWIVSWFRWVWKR